MSVTQIGGSMEDKISIADAAFRLGLSYQQTRDRLFKGILRGGVDAQGRYYVDARDVERVRADPSRSTRSAGDQS